MRFHRAILLPGESPADLHGEVAEAVEIIGKSDPPPVLAEHDETPEASREKNLGHIVPFDREGRCPARIAGDALRAQHDPTIVDP